MIEETPFALPAEKQDERVPWKPANAVERCESSGGHRVKAPSWPPAKSPSKDEPPSFNLKCRRCEAWIIVYTLDQKGVKVEIPQEKTPQVSQGR